MKRRVVQTGYVKNDWEDRIRWENGEPYEKLHITLHKRPFKEVYPDIDKWVRKRIKDYDDNDEIQVRVIIEEI